jgi:hypothetical protein
LLIVAQSQFCLDCSGVEDPRGCIERSKEEYEKHKSETILGSTIWNDVYFLGHGSSGTSLAGALLDAHPNIIIAHEYDVPGKWTGLKKKQQTRDYLFQALFTNSYKQSKFGRRQENCPRIRSMNVPNQWQGKFDKRIKVISCLIIGIIEQ